MESIGSKFSAATSGARGVNFGARDLVGNMKHPAETRVPKKFSVEPQCLVADRVLVAVSKWASGRSFTVLNPLPFPTEPAPEPPKSENPET